MKLTTHPVYCAIDTQDMKQARCLISQLAASGCGIKLGLEFFNRFGPSGIVEAMQATSHTPLFLDLKFHDIPNTVAGAVTSIVSQLDVAYLNLHASGGPEMMRRAAAAAKEAAAEAGREAPKMLAVTVLTSLGSEDLVAVGWDEDSSQQVARLARLSKDCDMDGVVCSSHEIEIVREACGDDFIQMVPGIRPAGSANQDQTRVMTPVDAIKKGAHHLVIGRPITQSEHPEQTARDILQSVRNAA